MRGALSRRAGVVVCGCTLAGLAFGWAGCGKAPPPTPKPPDPVTIVAPPEPKEAKAPPPAPIKASLVIVSGADTNPDRNGKPSAIVVRVYQLRRDAMFTGAAFLQLFDNEKDALGQDLITRDEFVLAPSERKTIDVVLTPETRFVGTLAAFRDYRSSVWQAIAPVPFKALNVAVDRARVVVTAN
jgi:type VI secretion system protein VasD